MSFVKEVVTSLISSSIILGLFLFIVKKYFDKLLSTEFDIRSKRAHSKIDQAFKVAGIMIEKEVGVYPEILEITYRLRNIIREGFKESLAYKWSPDFRPLCAHLTENLYNYRLLLSEEIFKALHDFKQIAQDVLMFCDIQTRQENIFDRDGYQKKIREFEPKYRKLDELYNLIEEKIREKLHLLTKC